MNDLDFIDALRDEGEDSPERLLQKMKTAGMTPGQMSALAALAGSTLVGGAHFLGSYSRNGNPSADQRSANLALKRQQAEDKELSKEKRPKSFKEDMNSIMAPANKDFADVSNKHPVRASLKVAPIGAMAGLAILRALAGK